jgi:hypothetical protein
MLLFSLFGSTLDNVTFGDHCSFARQGSADPGYVERDQRLGRGSDSLF